MPGLMSDADASRVFETYADAANANAMFLRQWVTNLCGEIDTQTAVKAATCLQDLEAVRRSLRQLALMLHEVPEVK